MEIIVISASCCGCRVNVFEISRMRRDTFGASVCCFPSFYLYKERLSHGIEHIYFLNKKFKVTNPSVKAVKVNDFKINKRRLTQMRSDV